MTQVRQLREFRGMTQEDFADFCGVSRMTISRAERLGKISSESAVHIAEACGVTVGFVLGIEDKDVFVSPGRQSKSPAPDGTGSTVDVASAPKTPQARILAAGIDRMPERDREKALNFVMMMFEQYADFFERSDDDDN